MKKLLLIAALLLAPLLATAQDPAPEQPAAAPAVTATAPAAAPAALPAAPPAAVPAAEPAAPVKPSAWSKLSELIFGAGWNIFSYLVFALMPLLTTLLGFLAKWIGNKTGSEKAASILGRLSTVLMDSVKATWEVYVKDIKRGKADGKLEENEKSRARSLAIDFARTYLGPKGISLLLDTLGIKDGELDGVLGKLLEPYVRKAKDEAATVGPPKAP